MTQYNSNIERQNHANATKEEKARHNGVDTSRWGNDAPRIAVPEGWEDHQHTQQLIRKYLRNDDVLFDIEKRTLTILVTQEEWDTMFAVPSYKEYHTCENEKYAYDIEFRNDGNFKTDWQICNIMKCSVALSRTALGFCINKYILREYNQGDVLIKPRAEQYIFDMNFSVDYKSPVFDEVFVMIRN